jgi:hypothetical protein
MNMTHLNPTKGHADTAVRVVIIAVILFGLYSLVSSLFIGPVLAP